MMVTAMSDREQEAVRLLRSSLDEPGPARRISRDREADIARAVCDEAARVGRVPPARSKARWLGRAAAAIALTSALSAAAALGWARWTSRSSAPAVSVLPARAAAPAQSGAATEHRAEPTTPRQGPSRAPAVRKMAAVSSPSAAAQRGHQVRAAVPMQDSLERANRLRAERRWREAADAYASVVAAGPPRAASVAAVAQATLLMGPLHRPAEALAVFRRALVLAPTGPVSDEALYGIATSFRELGNGRAEREALRRLLDERPSSPLRGQAEKRLAALIGN